jgi:hypothetical protein
MSATNGDGKSIWPSNYDRAIEKMREQLIPPASLPLGPYDSEKKKEEPCG